VPALVSPREGNLLDPALVDQFKNGVDLVALGIEVIAAAIIAFAAIEGAVRVVGVFLHPSENPALKEELRLRLGRWLSLALEFELASDILKTAVAPNWSQIEQLAAIAAIRTGLNYFLERDIGQAAKAQRESNELNTEVQRQQSA